MDEEKLTELLQRLGSQEKKREEFMKKVAVLDAKIVQTKLDYATTYNQRSPIMRIPIELMSSIFQAAIESDEEGEGTGMLFKLSHVCHLWRSITISLPDFWTSFACTGRPSNHDLDRLSTHLERSCDRLLNLHFEIDAGKDDHPWENILRTAIGQAPRWRSFVLRSDPDPRYWRNFLSNIFTDPISVPNLEVVEIFIGTGTSKRIPFDLPDRLYFQGGAPKLAHASFDSWSLMACKPLSNVTTLQITQQSATQYSFSAFLDILMLPRLINLSVLGDPFRPPIVGVQPVVAPELRNFRFAGSFTLSFRLFKYLEAPKLELLIIVRTIMDDSSAFPSNTDPIPFPYLRSLALIDCPTNSYCASRLAHLTENVTNLYISNDSTVCTSEDLFTVMVEGVKTSPGTILWPQLEALYCNVDDAMQGFDPSEDFQYFLKVVTSRWESLKKHCTLYLSDEDAEAWRTLGPVTWKQLVDGEFFARIGISPGELDFVPWPPRTTQKFDKKWERKFLTSRASKKLE